MRRLSGRPLAHQSLGRETLRIQEGAKSARRLLWAAVRLVGMDVADYVPDAKALELYDRWSREARFVSTPAAD